MFVSSERRLCRLQANARWRRLLPIFLADVKTLRKLCGWILACGAVVSAGNAVFAADVLFLDTFYLGPRPRGNRGDLRDAFPNTSLNDFWLQLPGTNTARWIARDCHDFGWLFSASSIDPNEPPEDAFGGNGTITARGRGRVGAQRCRSAPMGPRRR